MHPPSPGHAPRSAWHESARPVTLPGRSPWTVPLRGWIGSHRGELRMEAAGAAPAGAGPPPPAAARLAWAALGCSLLLVVAGVGLRALGPRAGAYPFWGEVVVIV